MTASRIRGLILLAGVYAVLILLHRPWICLPYYWDEAGYYAPAALDFYHQGLLIPVSTQKLGHTPLLTLWVGTVWRIAGSSPCLARLAMLFVAAAAVAATYALGRRVAGRAAGAWAAALLAVSPLFFAQGSMLHIDLGPTLFVTLAVWTLLPRRTHGGDGSLSDATTTAAAVSDRRLWAFAAAASLAVLSKETAVILLPVAWAYARRLRRELRQRDWIALGFPLLPLAVWALYYHHSTGYWTGNAEYLRYNLYSTVSPVRILLSLLRRVYQLFLGGFDWILIAGALAGLWWERRRKRVEATGSLPEAPASPSGDWAGDPLPPGEAAFLRHVLRKAGLPEASMTETSEAEANAAGVSASSEGTRAGTHTDAAAHAVTPGQDDGTSRFAGFLFLAGGLCAMYIAFHSVIGGALLRRYLLPVFPLFFIVAVALIWKLPSKLAHAVCVLAAAYFVAAWFINPPYPFAYEDNLAYADFIRLHQRAARDLESAPGNPRILTAWPATGELTVASLGYIDRPLRVVPVEGFAPGDFSQVPADSFDVLYLYSRKWEPPDDWLARFPALERLQLRYFDYERQISDADLIGRYKLRLVAEHHRRGQWVRIYSK